MKLPDFRNNNSFKILLSRMDAKPIAWSSQNQWRGLDLSQWEQLKTVGLEVPIEEIVIADDDTFLWNNQKVLVYIRDQYLVNGEINEYKYHVANCRTIESFRNTNRLHRYVVSTRTDGIFIVNTVDWNNREVVEEGLKKELQVCSNCLSRIGHLRRGMNREKSVSSFSLDDFFAHNHPDFKELPQHTDRTAPINDYAPYHSNLSRQVRKESGYICEDCGADMSNDKHLLHLHHIDGNKQNNHSKNLKTLCKTCHNKEHERSIDKRFTYEEPPPINNAQVLVDNPESASGYNTEEETAPLDQDHKSFTEGQTGVNFDDLFGPYLQDATEVTVTDPYIRMYHQAKNLLEFIETLSRHNKRESITVQLFTSSDEYKPELQLEQLERVKEASQKMNISFTYEFQNKSNIHARHITTDAGWKILLDRGLDVFQKYNVTDVLSLESRDQNYRLVKAFEVTYLKTN